MPERVLPLLLGAAAAAFMAAPLLRALRDAGATVENYRGVRLPCPLGLLLPAAAVVAMVPLGLLILADARDAALVAAPGFVLGVAVLGLADDVFSGASRGWRGHGRAVLTGAFSTGALKAVGILGLALFFTATPDDADTAILSALVLVLATNLFNLFDLRPGRAVKAYVLVALGCCLLAWDEATASSLGLYTGAILVAGFFDVRERGMLGDTGSNVVGAVAGLWLVASIDSASGLAVCAAVLAGITAYGEFRSISGLVERTPGLRHLDSIGRVHRA